MKQQVKGERERKRETKRGRGKINKSSIFSFFLSLFSLLILLFKEEKLRKKKKRKKKKRKEKEIPSINAFLSLKFCYTLHIHSLLPPFISRDPHLFLCFFLSFVVLCGWSIWSVGGFVLGWVGGGGVLVGGIGEVGE